MIRRRATISPLGCWLLGALVAAALFGLATWDLWWPGLSYPVAGERTVVSYRFPAVGILLELDERSLYTRGRMEVPVGSRVVEWPPGGRGRRVERFELRAGDQVEHRDVSFLRALEEHRRPPSLGFALGLAVLLLGTFVMASHAVRIFVTHGERLRTQLVLFVPLLGVLALYKALLVFTPISVFWLPLAAISMSFGILHSRLAGAIVGLVGAVGAGALFPMDWALVTTLSAQALVPPLVMAPLRKRRTLGLSWIAGAGAALAAYAGYQVLTEGALPPADLRDWQHSGLVATLGAALLSPLLALVITPLLGALLGILSRARLMYLADLDQPLLRHVATEAPGTWQHTLSVANMAEVVCNAIGANGTLVRVGAYYHDVGKSLDPTFFAENLKPGERSPHLDLAPEESAAVIVDHVVDGVRLAREHRVPFAVREFIYTHHGDGLLEFFWHKCQEQGNPRSLPEEVFHYTGVQPQSRETAVLALVDATEAAAKSLKDPSSDQIDDLVRRIVFAKLDARQLDHSGLTAAELATLAATLREILRSQFHLRPEYPWQKKARGEVAAAAPAPPSEGGTPPEAGAPAPAPGSKSETTPIPPSGASPGAHSAPPPDATSETAAGVAGASRLVQEPAPSAVISLALQGDTTGPRPKVEDPSPSVAAHGVVASPGSPPSSTVETSAGNAPLSEATVVEAPAGARAADRAEPDGPATLAPDTPAEDLPDPDTVREVPRRHDPADPPR